MNFSLRDFFLHSSGAMINCVKIVQMNIQNLHLPNNILLAPMAGITDLPYRLLMRQFGVGLAFTEMVSANGLVRAGVRTRALLQSLPEDRPLGIQLFGEDPAVLAEAARQVETDGDLIDLNLGCPVKKVVRSGAGSALMRTPRRVAAIVAAVRRATTLPLTVKIRAGWDTESINCREIAAIAVAEGADAVILHPRTRSQGFSGQADWQLIAELKNHLTVPVIGSGDIFQAEDAMRMLRETDCDAVMIGRGCYGNPWLARNILNLMQERTTSQPTIAERRDIALYHLRIFIRYHGERKAVLDMRKHLCWYARGLPGAARFRVAINRADTINAMQNLVRQFFLPASQYEEGTP